MGSVTGCVGQVCGGAQALSYCPFPQIKYMLVNWYISVCTEYISIHTGMYCVYKNISEDAVLCRMTVGNDPVCA